MVPALRNTAIDRSSRAERAQFFVFTFLPHHFDTPPPPNKIKTFKFSRSIPLNLFLKQLSCLPWVTNNQTTNKPANNHTYLSPPKINNPLLLKNENIAALLVSTAVCRCGTARMLPSHTSAYSLCTTNQPTAHAKKRNNGGSPALCATCTNRALVLCGVVVARALRNPERHKKNRLIFR